LADVSDLAHHVAWCNDQKTRGKKIQEQRVRSHPTAIACGAWSGPRQAATSAGRIGLIACAIVVLAAGGCGPSKFKALTTQAEFEEQVLKADKPVLVDFFKGGCASCMFLDPCMDQLSEEYKDRVTFFKFEGMRFWLEIPCIEVIKRYRIGLYPTVLLFVNGKEKKRWAINYSGDAYRMVLDEVLAPSGTAPKPPESPVPPDTKNAPGQPAAPGVAPQAPAGGGSAPAAPATPARTGELPGTNMAPAPPDKRAEKY
jgi:thioredoxin 1